MNTNVQSIKELIIRDLNSLEKEIQSYIRSADIWKIEGDIKNSAGNLTLHICGNLQHFIGAIVGKDGYIRKREEEFASKNLSIEELMDEVSATKQAVEKALSNLSDDHLEQIYPVEVFGKPITFSYFLIHLTGHLMYHLGQINYHRRLLAS
ncbi:MAG: DinB family protein [Reichenbachiella sp.]|uniref:DinB family protein n=1 Tax=Reichenbachiella sp. TaxID=2184521 RepID=UPI003264E634